MDKKTLLALKCKAFVNDIVRTIDGVLNHANNNLAIKCGTSIKPTHTMPNEIWQPKEQVTRVT